MVIASYQMEVDVADKRHRTRSKGIFSISFSNPTASLKLCEKYILHHFMSEMYPSLIALIFLSLHVLFPSALGTSNTRAVQVSNIEGHSIYANLQSYI
ncbi:uncharacterized [Tachysurus ichikawai]